MLLRLIAPQWLLKQKPKARRVYEGDYNEEQWKSLNARGYNVYYLPNYPSEYKVGQTVDGSQIDVFTSVFVDFDLKSGIYESKNAFIQELGVFSLPPTSVVDSGGGVHAYWRVSDLDAKSYLRLCRRLMRHFRTDEAVGQLYQLMRLPGSVNTKAATNPLECKELFSMEGSYTCEQLDTALPPILQSDEDYCNQHYEKTYALQNEAKVYDTIPHKFKVLIRESKEASEIWKGNTEDRSKADYRLGHLMFAASFTRDEAMSVLVNSAKALARAPVHRVSYAESIVDKIWTHETDENSDDLLSESVEDILNRFGDEVKGTRFPCHPLIDNTIHGFRLGQLIGLVGGSGIGKTTFSMNMFRWFVERNPDYDHLFVSLEQPVNEIAERWALVCQGDKRLHKKVHIMGNYNKDGSFRRLSLAELEEYIPKLEKRLGRKIGVVVIDHVGVLKKQNKNGERQGLIEVFEQMKPFAVTTNTMVVIQSQAPREKAGEGDLELNKDAAYGGVQFESYVDYLVTLWQPVKKFYVQGAPTVMAYKFCKVRHKLQGKDKIQEDVPYTVFFEPETQQLRELIQEEEKALSYWSAKAASKRKEDRKTQLVEYVSLKVSNDQDNQDVSGTEPA